MRGTVDMVIRLVDDRGRTITTTSYPSAREGLARTIGAHYREGWNDSGYAQWGDDFRSFASGFEVHDDTGRILAYG